MHYPAISKIVISTIEQFDLPYHNHKTLWEAIGSHQRHLKELGDPNYVVTMPQAQAEAQPVKELA